MLGIDALFVDEAHLHKNLYRFPKMTRVAGLPLTSSERAFDLFLKTRYTMQLHGHAQRGVVFGRHGDAGGQPTMPEIHTLMRYLRPNRLAGSGCSSSMPGPPPSANVTALEIARTAPGLPDARPLPGSSNVPGLVGVYGGKWPTIRTAEMLDLPVPKLRGGKPRIVACPASPSLKALRADAGPAGGRHPRQRRQAGRKQRAGDHHRRPQGPRWISGWVKRRWRLSTTHNGKGGRLRVGRSMPSGDARADFRGAR
ncbi:MAG: hypothetical protein IPL15_24825 [Comamonadaceae bacterium]|uniref:hypothetical protein n=1 Tax=Candidatus Skiveiella danica TaxID=3386177 RepID=UPI0039094381|nr:hypothetical protein [Comamonadaceae bacterium]